MTSVVVDAMGGDLGPEPVVEGAAAASLLNPLDFDDVPSTIELVGDPVRLEALLQKHEHHRRRIRIIDAEQSIPMDTSTKDILRDYPRSSMLIAAQRVRDKGPNAALVSAGNTGALIRSCAHHFERIPNIERCALAAVVPTERRRGGKNDPFSLLLDVGATLRASSEALLGFARMGVRYASIISKNPKPRVALLSNGTEANKGLPEIVSAHRLLAGIPNAEFIGNIEALDIHRGVADVIVCDGFTGNIVLKMFEGTAELVSDLARYAYRSRFSWRLGFWLLNSGFRQLKAVTDWQQYGGAPILGFSHLCIKAHGRSGPRAHRNAIRVAERCIAERLCAILAS